MQQTVSLSPPPHTHTTAPYAPGSKGRNTYGDWTYTAVFPICLERVVGQDCKPFEEDAAAAGAEDVERDQEEY